MDITVIDQIFSLCQVRDLSQIDYTGEYCFVGKTDDEISLICAAQSAPANALTCDTGWRAMKIRGVWDFTQIGVLAKISARLAQNSIAVLAVSTYNTDYIFTKAEHFEKAAALVREIPLKPTV